TAGINYQILFSIDKQMDLHGTGHAVLQTRHLFTGPGRAIPEHFLLLNGDTPLLQEATIRQLLLVHQKEQAAVTILTAQLDDASGYGRGVREPPSGNRVLRIAENGSPQANEKMI